MSDTRPGNHVPSKFIHDQRVTGALRQAALDARNQFGPRKRKENLTFRASELGSVVDALDQKGTPSGCSRRVFYSFWADKYNATPLDADAVLNFGRGDLEEVHGERLLKQAGLLVESHVKFGAWDPNAENERWRADPRYPDRSGGRIRGDCDFIINHPEFGVVPLDWKSSSSYSFQPLSKVGGKVDNVIQVAWYAYEMKKDYYSIGYVNKEDGQLCVLTYETPHEWIENVLFPACDDLAAKIHAGEVPPRPEGTRPAKDLFDRVWPCHTFSPKKKRVYQCPFYRDCHGEAPPQPGDKPAKKSAAKKPARKKITRKSKATDEPAPSEKDLHFK